MAGLFAMDAAIDASFPETLVRIPWRTGMSIQQGEFS